MGVGSGADGVVPVLGIVSPERGIVGRTVRRVCPSSDNGDGEWGGRAVLSGGNWRRRRGSPSVSIPTLQLKGPGSQGLSFLDCQHGGAHYGSLDLGSITQKTFP